VAQPIPVEEAPVEEMQAVDGTAEEAPAEPAYVEGDGTVEYAHAEEVAQEAAQEAAHEPGSVELMEEEYLHTRAHVDEYLRVGQDYGASDIHLGVNAPPIWRRHGTLMPIWPHADRLSAQDTERLAMGFLNDEQKQMLRDRGDIDFAYATEFGRFRASVVRQRIGIDVVFRIISTNLRSMDQLGLPQSLKLLTQYHNGLVLVTGSVGSGKSTTLAALIDEINKNRHDHIITLEDPIEYIINSKNCHVTQREVHTHTKSFGAALRGALREDPDVIMVGEMRDLETISLAITASETGHLVLGTLHTGSAARTLDRVLDVFPIDQREQIRVMVSESLRGIISQALIPRQDGNGRVLALEILTNTPAVGNLIREAKTYMLPGVMQTGKKQGMKLMDDSLMELYDAGYISQEEAYVRAEQKALMRQHFAH
jgi:twitching motility protein PilT